MFWHHHDYLFQKSDGKLVGEMNSIVKADIKVDSEEFFDTSDDQANYDGKR